LYSQVEMSVRFDANQRTYSTPDTKILAYLPGPYPRAREYNVSARVAWYLERVKTR
jgi:hypothetical protein